MQELGFCYIQLHLSSYIKIIFTKYTDILFFNVVSYMFLPNVLLYNMLANVG